MKMPPKVAPVSFAEEEGLAAPIPKMWTLQMKQVRPAGFFHFMTCPYKPKKKA
jgi:hypothetical protein